VGGSADVATVSFGLKVVDSASGAPVLDATVRGGPAGAMIPLVVDPSDPGRYSGQRTGYSGAWEFSIARGGEIVWDVPLTGPSFPTTACAIDWYLSPPAVTVSWAPFGEPGVAGGVKVSQTVPAPPPYSSSVGTSVHDEGTAGPFSLSPSAVPGYLYAIIVDLWTDRLFDWGGAVIQVTSSVTCK